MLILVINTGSSSIKYSLIDMDGEKFLTRGNVECIGLDNSVLKYDTEDGERVEVKRRIENHESAVKLIIEILTGRIIDDIGKISAVGHRIGHGAEKLFESVEIDERVMGIIRENIPLVPLHMPHMAKGVEVFRKLLPGIPMVAVFDTAFHQTIPKKAYLYAIPYEYYLKYGIRRYGFHGPSHKYVSEKAARMLGVPGDSIKTVTCHLGSGSSIAAVDGGRSVDTSMGFTPLAGVPMGTRCGDIDVAIAGRLMEKEKLSYPEVESILNRKSGFLGLSGLSSDFRKIEQHAGAGDEKAAMTIDVFCYSVKKYIGAYAAAMGGLDCIVFTGGIGENSKKVRSEVCSGLDFLGVRLDAEKNKNGGRGDAVLSADDSRVKICLVNTNEELMIARETKEVLSE